MSIAYTLTSAFLPINCHQRRYHYWLSPRQKPILEVPALDLARFGLAHAEAALWCCQLGDMANFISELHFRTRRRASSCERLG